MPRLWTISRALLLASAAARTAGAASLPSPQTVRGTVEYVRTIDSVREYTKPKSMWGRLLEFVAGQPENEPRLIRPYAVTSDSLGRLLVADPGQRVVHIFDPEKRRYTFLRGPRSQPLQMPVGCATDAADNIYVSDSQLPRILVFDQTGKFLRTLGGPASARPLLRPTGLALDATRNLLYVADTLRHDVEVFRLDGTLVRTIGRRGTGPGEFNYPTAVALAGGRLHVVDTLNFRVQSLTPEGKFPAMFGRAGNRSGTFSRPKGIAADTDGHLYVVDGLFETVQIFGPGGELLHYFGATGTQPGQFELPAGIHIDPRNRIYVADSYNRRVQIFRYRREGTR